MNVYLTNTTKKHNSTAVPTFSGSAIPCMLKEGSSIIDPVLIFERANIGHTYNYVSIPDFGRYYFVNDIVYDGARIYYHCSVDVLASYKSTIGGSSAYVLRSAYENNKYIIDQYYPVTTHIRQYKEVVDAGPWFDYGAGRGRWVVGVVNNAGITYYAFTNTNYKRFLKYLLSDAFMNDLGVDLSINPQLRVAVDPIQYVTSCVWLPFNPQTDTTPPQPRFPDEDVKVAKLDSISDTQGVIQAGNVSSGSAGYTVHDYTLTPMPHPQSNARGEYLNSSPFSECRFVCPPFGKYDLDPLEIQQYDWLRAMVQVDCTTGIGKLRIYGYIDTDQDSDLNDELPVATIATAEAQIGVPIPVTQIITPGVSPVQLGLQAAGAIASLAKGDIGGAISGGASAIESYQAGKIPKSSVIGSRGSLAALTGYASLEYVWRYVADNDVADHGQPLCAVRQLSTLPGFQMIQEPHIHTTGTASEDDQINAFLSGGYFYE